MDAEPWGLGTVSGTAGLGYREIWIQTVPMDMHNAGHEFRGTWIPCVPNLAAER